MKLVLDAVRRRIGGDHRRSLKRTGKVVANGVQQRLIDRSELYTADEVFLTGTAAHIQGVGSVDHRPVGDGEIGAITRKLQDLYFPIVQGRDPAYIHQCWSATPKVTAS